jgi:hypothetical protein
MVGGAVVPTMSRSVLLQTYSTQSLEGDLSAGILFGSSNTVD